MNYYSTKIATFSNDTFNGTSCNDAILFTSQSTQAIFIGSYPDIVTNPNKTPSLHIQNNQITANQPTTFQAGVGITNGLTTDALSISNGATVAGGATVSGGLKIR